MAIYKVDGSARGSNTALPQSRVGLRTYCPITDSLPEWRLIGLILCAVCIHAHRIGEDKSKRSCVS